MIVMTTGEIIAILEQDVDDEGVGDSGQEGEDREDDPIERGGEVGGSEGLGRVHHPAGPNGDTTKI